MLKIAATSNGRCVHRAFSTMRLALGYKEGLPKNFQCDYAPKTKNLFYWASSFFPNHKVIISSPSEYVPSLCPKNTEYVGSMVAFGIGDGEFDEDNYLWAFAYMKEKDSSNAHMVIGMPKQYDGIPVISIIVGVQLEKDDATC